MIPDYYQPLKFKEFNDIHWSRQLGIYKTKQHDPSCVYMYVTDNDKPFAAIAYDKFPKSSVHLLIIPYNIDVKRPDLFQKHHLHELKKLHIFSYKICDDLEKKYNMKFLVGYHAIPSMLDIHLHIISNDFISDNLKRREHYQSFVNPNYFLSPEKIEYDLENYSIVHISINTILRNQLKNDLLICNNCNYKSNDFNDFKKHLSSHRQLK